jgi:hypothetical protein
VSLELNNHNELELTEYVAWKEEAVVALVFSVIFLYSDTIRLFCNRVNTL